MSRVDGNVLFFGFLIAFLCSGNKIGQCISTAAMQCCTHKLHSTVNHCYDVTHCTQFDRHTFIMKPIFMFNRCATKLTNAKSERSRECKKKHRGQTTVRKSCTFPKHQLVFVHLEQHVHVHVTKNDAKKKGKHALVFVVVLSFALKFVSLG